MATMENVDMTDAHANGDAHDPKMYSELLKTNYIDSFAFSETEQRALDLYDQLRELEMQLSLLQAQESADVPDLSALSDDEVQEQLTIAEREAMEARAEYELRNKITHNVLVMDPVLKAVHGGDRTGFAEKRTLPMIAENDAISLVHGSISSKLASSRRELSELKRANIAANKQNRELAQTMLELAEEMKSQSIEEIEDPRLREEAETAEKELRASRRRMRTMKGVVSAMVVGSGINWAADEELTKLVLDDEDD